MTIGRSVTVEGQELEKADRFVSLCSALCEGGDDRREVIARNGKASTAFNGLRKCMEKCGARKIRRKIFRRKIYRRTIFRRKELSP